MSAAQTARWWREEKGQPHGVLLKVVAHIRERQAWRKRAHEYHNELYGGGSGASALGGYSGATEYLPSTLPYNIVRSGIDTLTAKITKNRPLPQILTLHGDESLQKKGRRLSRFLQGEFAKQKVHERLSPRCVRDALIFGTGIAFSYIDRSGEHPQIRSEFAFPWEIFVDDYDARYGDPRNYYYVKTVDRDELIDMYPDHRAEIETAGRLEDVAETGVEYDEDATVDRVHVVMAWHLAHGNTPGRFVLAIQGKTLEDSEYKRDYAPFAVLHYSEPVAGYWGTGLAEIAEGFQYELNSIGCKVQEQHHMLGSGWVIVPTGPGSLKEGDVTNGLRTLFCAPGMEPKVVLNQPVHPQTYQYLRDLSPDALQFMGVSSLSARSEKPAGVDSGIAMRTLSDVETERFFTFGKAHEAWCTELGRQYIDLATEIGEEYPDFAASFADSKRGIIPLRWADVRMERDQYELQVTPTSQLSKDFGEKLQQVIDLKERGDAFTDRATFLRLIGMPDLDEALDLETSPQNVMAEQIAAMIEADDPSDPSAFQQPEPQFDLKWGATRAQAEYCLRRARGASEETLELLRRYWLECERLETIKQAKEAAAAAPALAAGPMPPGAPPPLGAPPPPVPEPTAPMGDVAPPVAA